MAIWSLDGDPAYQSDEMPSLLFQIGNLLKWTDFLVNTVIAVRMARFLGNYVDANNLGYVTGADGGFKLAENQVRQPDADFVSKERYDSLPDEFEGGPDIAVEVISPREDALGKASEYLEAGTKLV